MFKSARWLHKLLTVSAASPLSDLIISVKNVRFFSDNVSLIRVFSLRSLCKTFQDVERVASFVPM